jgi:hypothetical protein
LKIRITDFNKEYQRTKKELANMPCEGRTETLKSIKKERYKTEKQKMME